MCFDIIDTLCERSITRTEGIKIYFVYDQQTESQVSIDRVKLRQLIGEPSNVIETNAMVSCRKLRACPSVVLAKTVTAKFTILMPSLSKKPHPCQIFTCMAILPRDLVQKFRLQAGLNQKFVRITSEG